MRTIFVWLICVVSALGSPERGRDKYPLLLLLFWWLLTPVPSVLHPRPGVITRTVVFFAFQLTWLTWKMLSQLTLRWMLLLIPCQRWDTKTATGNSFRLKRCWSVTWGWFSLCLTLKDKQPRALLIQTSSPWYDLRGWLGIKSQLRICLIHPDAAFGTLYKLPNNKIMFSESLWKFAQCLVCLWTFILRKIRLLHSFFLLCCLWYVMPHSFYLDQQSDQ